MVLSSGIMTYVKYKSANAYLNEQLHSAMDQKDGQINALNTTISHLQRHIAILEGKIF